MVVDEEINAKIREGELRKSLATWLFGCSRARQRAVTTAIRKNLQASILCKAVRSARAALWLAWAILAIDVFCFLQRDTRADGKR